ncbi:MAG: UDP-3-O-(3-hydroxymyristoyl)glucosamine N-acyltransferase [Rickettsiales bacterium]|nr:UDP-3-O-(3-hydroxymyristoyl)glucosamine N-acyltransferase [Rickettsiales bacterium]
MERFYDIIAEITLGEIERLTGAKLADESRRGFKVTNLGSLERMDGRSVIYVAFDSAAAKSLNMDAKYRELLKGATAGAAFVDERGARLLPACVIPLVTPDPKLAFIRLTEYMYKDKAIAMRGVSERASIHPSVEFKDKGRVHVGDFAVLEEGVSLGADCYIGAGAKIKAGVAMGDGCIIRENAVVSHAVLGDNVRVGEGTVIGGNGFGWHSGPSGHTWVPQLGRVVLESGVDIGSNTCVDRGAIGDTVIGAGTKIDNLVQVAHNVRIGRNCIFAGMSGIAGSTVIGDWTLVGAQAGISGHLTIGAGSQIGASAGVIQDLPPGSKVAGYPAVPAREFLKQAALMKRMYRKKP